MCTFLCVWEKERGVSWLQFELPTDHWHWCVVRTPILHHRDRHLWSTPLFSFWVTLTISPSASTAHTVSLSHLVCVCACVSAFVLNLCCKPVRLKVLSLSVSPCEMEAGVACIEAGQMHCKWISHTHRAETSWCQLCWRWWILMSFQHVFSRHSEGMVKLYYPPMCAWAPWCFKSLVFH